MFKNGNRMVCIDDVWPVWVKMFYTQLPKKGSIYTLRDFDMGCNPNTASENSDKSLLLSGSKEYTVWVHECVNPIHPISKKEPGFSAKRFAPIENISIEQAEHLMDVIYAPSKPELVPA